jgi:LuxR family maltose regulon positive regulatory protein
LLSDPVLTLIRSKLLTPSPTGLLHRPQVCQTIEQGLERKLTLISAPAGYGKTSALVDFARHSPVPVCWYTVDERDRDLGLFIRYLVEAIGERFSNFGERTRQALTSLDSDLFNDPTAVVGELVNEMLELDTPFVVVMDNYEVLDGAFGIRTFVHRLLQVLPFNCHLTLGSRRLPDVPITRLVAGRQLIGLTEKNLRFDYREVRALLRLSCIEISPSQAQAIAANSEGWIMGILLLANLLRDEAEAALSNVEKATTQTYSYLAREVLSRQPPDVQHFLHTSAVLREMSPQLCREVLQIKKPSGLLEEVVRRNLFVTRFGESSAATYRYHNLFRDFLHEQFRRQNPAHCVALHLWAAKQFERENDIEEAVYHYLAAETYPEATALMERVAMQWFTRGRVETLLRWTKTLPEEIRAKAPWLSFYQSRVLTDRYDYAGARRALIHAEVGFAAQRDKALLSRVHNQRATLALFEGHYEDVIAEAQTALEMLDQNKVIERAEAQRLIGIAYIRQGRLAESVTKLQNALALCQQAGSPYDVANSLQDVALALTAWGRLGEATSYLNEALAIRRRLGAAAPLAGVLNNLGYLHHLRGEYQESLTLYEEGLAAARRGDDPRWQAHVLIGMADLYRDIGVYERAEPLYEAAWQLVQTTEPRLAFCLLTVRADMYRWQENHTRALALLEQARQVATEKELDFEAHGLLLATEGIALAESGEVESGLHFLSNAVHFLEQREAKHDLARARFLLAKAHLLAGSKLQAAVELRQALVLADEMGAHQFAVAEGQHAEELLRLGVARNIASCRAIFEKVQQLKTYGERLAQVGAEAEQDAVDCLEIYALGEGLVVRDGHTILPSEWRAVMVKELFFYILLHSPLERDAIGLVFWPELSAEKVASNFHATLYRMRRAVGTNTVVTEDGQYRLGDVDYWFDVEAFETLIEQARLLPPHDRQTENLWRRAVALYRGDFLAGVERLWCVPKREMLREMYTEALIGMGRCHEARGELERAIGWYKQALEMNQWREDIHRRIMYCYAETGRQPEALAQYRHCREILRRELAIEPSAETNRLYRQIARKRAD